MTKKQKAALAVAALEKAYPEAICSLKESEPYRLLIAVRLSAQCTDARVNLVTPVLFERFPTLESLAFADVSEVEEIVHPCGFFRAKANDIVAMSRMLIEKYNSKVPDTIEELVKLPGVGRKTANLIVGDVYGKPAVVTDTHKGPRKGRKGAEGSARSREEQRFLPPLRAPRQGCVHSAPTELPRLRDERLLRLLLKAKIKQPPSRLPPRARSRRISAPREAFSF